MLKKIISILAILAVILVGVVLLLRNKKASYPLPAVGNNIIVFGDSLAYGQGSTTGNDLAGIIGTKLGLPTINAGVNGETTVSALSRVNKLMEQDPKIVIILLGGNDFLQGIPPDTTMNALGSIVDQIQRAGVGIILINEDKIFATTPRFAQLAKDKNIPYLENALGGIINHKELMSDQIHPNDAGYEIMAEKIIPILKAYLHL